MDKTLQTMIDNMPEKTGKSLDEWHQLLKQRSFAKHSEAVNYLKKDFGVTHGFANTIVHLYNAGDQQTDPAEDQYRGKERLLPIFESLQQFISSLGQDVELAPKKNYISVRRKKQFAILQPSTKSRFDLGLNIRGKEPEGKLEAAGSWNAMCTHRVRIENEQEVTKEVKGWIKEAYEQAG